MVSIEDRQKAGWTVSPAELLTWPLGCQFVEQHPVTCGRIGEGGRGAKIGRRESKRWENVGGRERRRSENRNGDIQDMEEWRRTAL